MLKGTEADSVKHQDGTQSLLEGFREHGRGFEDFVYAYPVLSRRARGLSLGLNLSPHKACNFDCLYCQVDRSVPGKTKTVSMELLETELSALLELTLSGEIFKVGKFTSAPEGLRRLNDIALSGDGEPTSEPVFEEVCQLLARFKEEGKIPKDTKLVVITNATRFHLEKVERGLQMLDPHEGEVWAKLDAGTEEYYQKVDLSKVPFERVIENLVLIASRRPVKVQTLFFEMEGEGPDARELDAYCSILEKMLVAGGKILEVQLHTVARDPKNHVALPLVSEELEGYAEMLRKRTGLEVSVYPGLRG